MGAGQLLRRKAAGFIQAIEKMGGEQQARQATVSVARDFDAMVRAVGDEEPKIGNYLPPVCSYYSTNTETYCEQHYSDLLVGAEQIHEMLGELLD